MKKRSLIVFAIHVGSAFLVLRDKRRTPAVNIRDRTLNDRVCFEITLSEIKTRNDRRKGDKLILFHGLFMKPESKVRHMA